MFRTGQETKESAKGPNTETDGSICCHGSFQPCYRSGWLSVFYNSAVALVIFLRGVNVGGYRTFRPSILAEGLRQYDVVNVGTAGTFVVRKPGSRTKLRAELLQRLPFEAQTMFCDGADLIRMEREHPFETAPPASDIVRFMSILSKSSRCATFLPCNLPASGEWLVRIMAAEGRFVFGEYRRRMKTIGYLRQIDKLFDATATTRNWNTIMAVVRILKTNA